MSLLCPMTVQISGGPTEKESIFMLLALECVSEGNGVIQPESPRTPVASRGIWKLYAAGWGNPLPVSQKHSERRSHLCACEWVRRALEKIFCLDVGRF
jgi:hypothetical protein